MQSVIKLCTLLCLWTLVVQAAAQSNLENIQEESRAEILSCSFEAPTYEDWLSYNDQLSEMSQHRSSSSNGEIVDLPVVLMMIRDDDGNVPSFFLNEWRNWVFSKSNHYLMENIGARLYLADLRLIDSTELYTTTETNNAVLVEDVYGPLGELDAVNIVIQDDDQGSFAPLPSTTLFPQSFVSIAYINIQHDSETPEHEFGHSFGLLHTHQSTEFGNDAGFAEHVPRVGADANCMDAGDHLCDTPADPCVGFGCPDNDDTEDIFGNPYATDTTNIMGFWITYRDHFTADQDSVMQDGLAFRLDDPDYNIQGYLPTTNPVAPVIDTFENTHLYNHIGWNNVTDNLGYLIERSSESDSTGFLPVYDWKSAIGLSDEMVNGATHTDVNFFLDKSIEAGVDYWYRVIAVNSPDQYSNVVFVQSDYDNAYCNLVVPCTPSGTPNQYLQDSVKILDSLHAVVFFDDEFFCDTEWDSHVEQTINLIEGHDYKMVPEFTVDQVSQMYANFFIDFNEDGDFEDTDEWVIENTWIGQGSGAIDTIPFSVPLQSEYGLKAGRMIFSTLFNQGMFMPIDNACEFPQSKFGFDLELDIQQDPCVAIQNLTGTQTVDIDYQASEQIISDQIIDANVTYSAEDVIELLEGFEVLVGREFEAFLDGCN